MVLEKNWTIRTRIVLSFAGILAAMMISASFAYVRLLHIDRLTSGVSGDILPALTSSSDIVVERVVNYSRTLEYAFETDRSKREEILKAIAAGRITIDTLLTGYKPTVSTRDEQELLDAYQRARASYREAQDEILKAGLDSNANRDDLVRRLTLEVRPKFERAQAAASAVRVHNELDAAESMRLIDAEVYDARRDLVLSVAIGLLIAFVFGYRLLRAVTMPLGRLVRMLDVMRTGDLSGRLDRGRDDEFGDVAKGFNRMTDELMGLVGQVQQSGVQVNTSITEIAATAREQQATASQIAATTTEIGATSREISATSRLLVGTMNEVATVAEQSAVLAGQGQSGLTHLEATMQRVTDAAAAINGKLRVLSDKAANISQVVTTITKVADQTNLLSLNAAIEAEKAGEYGRGFAVVATEIRRLADQTAVATYDIEQMVKEIQSAVAAGVMGMDKFSEEVRQGMQDVHQVGDQLSQVIQQVQALAPRVESINDGMQAQASGAAQITEALAQLSDAAQQTVDSLRQSGLAIDELNRVAAGLRSGVSRFTLQAA